MDVQLQELIDKIKKDGVSAAETSAAEIIAKSEKEAEKIIADAKSQAETLIKKAEEEIARKEKAGEDSIRQAARNLLITFRDGITAQLNALIKDECDKVYSSDLMAKLVPEVVKAWTAKNEAESISVLLSEKDLKDCESGLKAALKAEVSKGLTIKSDKGINGGFRIGVNNGEAFYDFTSESVSELFSAYLNPRIASLMKEAAK